LQYLIIDVFAIFRVHPKENRIMKISDFIERKITLILLEKDVKHNTVTIR